MSPVPPDSKGEDAPPAVRRLAEAGPSDEPGRDENGDPRLCVMFGWSERRVAIGGTHITDEALAAALDRWVSGRSVPDAEATPEVPGEDAGLLGGSVCLGMLPIRDLDALAALGCRGHLGARVPGREWATPSYAIVALDRPEDPRLSPAVAVGLAYPDEHGHEGDGLPVTDLRRDLAGTPSEEEHEHEPGACPPDCSAGGVLDGGRGPGRGGRR